MSNDSELNLLPLRQFVQMEVGTFSRRIQVQTIFGALMLGLMIWAWGQYQHLNVMTRALTERIIPALRSGDYDLAVGLADSVAALNQRVDVRITLYGDQMYPRSLRNLRDANTHLPTWTFAIPTSWEPNQFRQDGFVIQRITSLNLSDLMVVIALGCLLYSVPWMLSVRARRKLVARVVAPLERWLLDLQHATSAKDFETCRVSEVRALHHHLLELAQQLTRKEHLAALGDALGYFMHDIRPSLLILDHILKKGANHELPEPIDPKMRELGRRALARLEGELASYLERFRETAQLEIVERGSPSSSGVDLISVMERIQDEVRARHPGLLLNFRNTYSRSGASVWVPGDESIWFRMLSNLVENAFEGRGNTVGASVLELELRAEGSSPDWVLTLMDNGPGFLEQEIDVLNDMRATSIRSSKREGTSLGLGLKSVKAMAHQLGLTVQFSNHDSGARVRIHQ